MDTFPSPTALHDRFRGALLGTAVGDALGAPFDGSPTVNATDLAAWIHADAPLRWTDDTHMTIGVAESLIACGGFDGQHMAGRFVANHNAEPWRGYGAGPPIVFDGLRRGAAWDEPAAALFDGQGSYGNGAAMRAAPAGLFAVHDVADAAHLARQTARITHAHEFAQDGAALQSSAVAWLTTAAPTPHWLIALGLMQELRLVARTDVFQDKLAAVERLAGNVPVDDAAALLGTGVAAAEAVPAALFAFTRHIDSFTDAVTCAVQLGGDTDTIAAMTGALAGAFHGATAIPTPWRNRLEASDRLESLADELFTVAARQRADAETP
ncbi:MAG: ADP-ribosylglycohydrolase family protein [Actinobacteria bacterium]|nr:ADP-ribosylglycohydrolase family protein [Actinomycetota bacterium]